MKYKRKSYYINNTIISKQSDIAEIINDFFVSVAAYIGKDHTISDLQNHPSILEIKNTTNKQTIYFLPPQVVIYLKSKTAQYKKIVMYVMYVSETLYYIIHILNVCNVCVRQFLWFVILDVIMILIITLIKLI